MIYQLRDDILDLVAVDGQLGKPAGQDLAEGVYTLPTLVALADDEVGAELAEMLGRALDDDERERARKIVVSTNGVDETLKVAHEHVARAHEVVEELPDAGLRDGFRSLVSSLLEDLPLEGASVR
jgi:heptaprenyl diphosphate synthase